jgi:hypothetical protein
MRIGRNAAHTKGTKGVGIGPVKFDGWEVLLGGGIAMLILGYAIDNAPGFLVPLGVVLLALWLIAVVLVNLGIIGKPPTTPSSGGASASDKSTKK